MDNQEGAQNIDIYCPTKYELAQIRKIDKVKLVPIIVGFFGNTSQSIIYFLSCYNMKGQKNQLSIKSLNGI